MKKIIVALFLGMFLLTGCSDAEYEDQYGTEQLIESLENDGWTCNRSRCILAYEDYSYEYNLAENTYECSLDSVEIIEGNKEMSKFIVNIDFLELTGEGTWSYYVGSIGTDIEATYDYSSDSTTCTNGEEILCGYFLSTMESCYNQMTDYFADSGYTVLD
jgi:hypothetical protein